MAHGTRHFHLAQIQQEGDTTAESGCRGDLPEDRLIPSKRAGGGAILKEVTRNIMAETEAVRVCASGGAGTRSRIRSSATEQGSLGQVETECQQGCDSVRSIFTEHIFDWFAVAPRTQDSWPEDPQVPLAS